MRLGALSILLALGVAAAAPGASARDIRESPVHYVAIGPQNAPVLIAVNGGPGLDHRYLMAAPVWKELARSHRIIFYDQRGTGDSPVDVNKQMTVSQMVADLDALRRHLDAERVDLVGHSWGGILSMAYAAEHPEHVAHMILVGSGDAKPSQHEYLFDKLYPDIMETIEKPAGAAGETGCFETDAYDRMSYYDQRNRWLELGGDAPRFSQATCIAIMLDALKLDLYPRLAKLSVPTLVINGRFDANVAPTVAYRLSKAIPGARLEFFEHSGHSPHVEEAEKFALTVEGFLAGAR